MTKRLTLRREALSELTSQELAGLATGATRTFVACTVTEGPTCLTCGLCEQNTFVACSLTCTSCLTCALCS